MISIKITIHNLTPGELMGNYLLTKIYTKS